MSAAEPSSPDRDQPLDAILADPHPAVRPASDYPYAARVPPAVGPAPPPEPSPPFGFRFDPPAPAQYVVPQRFGMSAILGIMTGLAILFGSFRITNAHPLLYLFFGVQAIVICIAQMFYGQAPRAASAIAGAMLLPAFVLMGLMVDGRMGPSALCMMVGAAPVGAFLGYITGTMAAGVFLVMNMAEPLLKRRWPASAARANASSMEAQ
jgi:hypothetical protein